MKTGKIREILTGFKDLCKTQSWMVSEKDDWVKTEDEYHHFVWTRNTHPSSFQRITANGKCVVREGLSYRVVEASYMAWLFSEPPKKTLLDTICENPQFSQRTAIYYLGPVLEGKNLAYKLNSTDSIVFKDFEKFLRKQLGIKLEPFSESKISSGKRAVVKVA